MTAMPYWLITGGCGFLGRGLISALNARGPVGIRVLDNLSVGSLEDLAAVAAYEIVTDTSRLPRADQVQFLKGDIIDSELMLRATSRMHIVAHLAANTGVGPSVDNPRQDCITNVIGTLNALEAARAAGVRRFVFASSGAPIGEVEPPIHEELAPHPVSPYGASKLAGEAYCSAYARTFGVETVALRFGNVYGPGSKHKSSLIAKFIKDAMAKGVLQINGDGSQTRDFIYIDDLVAAILAASERPDIGGEVFQIATQRETSVMEIAELMRTALPKFGIKTPVLAYAEPRRGDVKRNYSDVSKARDRLGWAANIAVDEGIDRTISWFLNSGRAGGPAHG